MSLEITSDTDPRPHQAVAVLDRTPRAMWDRIRRRLHAEVGKEEFEAWLARVELIEVTLKGVVRVSVPTDFLRGWVRSRYGEMLLALWCEEDESIWRIDVIRRSVIRAALPPQVAREKKPLMVSTKEPPKKYLEGSALDPRLTFETFCKGRSNDLPLRAAHVASDARGKSSPARRLLYFHAPVGLGKTHLLQAIAHEAGRTRPRGSVVYLSALQFRVEFFEKLQNSPIELLEALKRIDLALIDDVQFLTGVTMQRWFSQLLIALLEENKQVVVAADRPPSQLEKADESARSRLMGGLVLKIDQPNTDLRRKVLDVKLAIERERNPSLDIKGDVLDYVAESVTSNCRDLVGALTRLVFRTECSDTTITREGAVEAIADLVGIREPPRIMVENIQKVVATHYKISRFDMLSARRTRNIVRPRQIAMYLCKTMTSKSFPEIGKRFGNRDHTTVLHAVRKIEELAAADDELKQEIELLRRIILD